MSKIPTISIVTPVYNVEKYLAECIDSVLAQTFTDIECILIDDGSTDNSPAICDEYAKKDARVKVIHKENGGVSSARNIGIDNARGEWIGFVDGDDRCDPEMYQVLYDNAVKTSADVSVCRFRIVDGDGKAYAADSHDNKLRILDNKAAALELFSLGSIQGHSFTKLVRSSLFHKTDVRYDITIRYLEDTLLFYKLFQIVDKVVDVSAPYYNYRVHSGSVANQQGLTEAAKTGFVALDKMLTGEKCSSAKKKIRAAKAFFAYGICLPYIKNDNCKDDGFIYARKILWDNIGCFLSDPAVPLKLKMLCPLTYLPGLYRCLYKI